MTRIDDQEPSIHTEVYTFEKKLVAAEALLHDLDFRELSVTRDLLRCQLIGYLTARELKNQKVEIPDGLLEHIKYSIYQRFPRLTSAIKHRFPVKWRDIMPTVLQAIDVPIISGHQTRLYVMEPFKF